MNILFATPECAPYVKTGGLGDVSGALPAALAAQGHSVRVLLPAYPGMEVSGERDDAVDLPPDGPWPAAQVRPVRVDKGVALLLLACPEMYQREGGPYVDASGRDHPDNALRFGLLSRVAARLGTGASPCPDWRADIVHANDWTCGLAPLYLAQARQQAAHGRTAASVFTIHNLAFQGLFGMEMAAALGIPDPWRGIDGVEFWGQLSMMKAGLQFADAITTVSPSYASEVQTQAFGAGLDGVLRWRASRLTGILNGIDTRAWNPAADPLIPHAFARGQLAGKARNKAALQERLGLPVDAGAMLFGVVSRLTAQKGIDLVLQALPLLLQRGGQLAVLGHGEPALEQALRDAARRHRGQVAVQVGFDEGLAHLIEAGADAFLMPSRFEPCGLNQMYSQAYGTPPVVAPVGGLLDSVADAGAEPLRGSGFVMPSADADGLAQALQQAMAAWREPARWRRIQDNGMARDFSWKDSAARYLQVYQRAIDTAVSDSARP